MSSKHKSHLPAKIAKNRTVLPSYEARSITADLSNNFASNYVSWEGGDNTSNTATWSTTWTGGNTDAGYYCFDGGTCWDDYGFISGTDITFQPAIAGVQTIIKEREVTKEVEKRTLYKVYIVDPRKGGKLLAEEAVIADSENQAMLKAGVATLAAQSGLEIEDLDVYVDEVGTFIRPKKQTQKVKVVKDEED